MFMMYVYVVEWFFISLYLFFCSCNFYVVKSFFKVDLMGIAFSDYQSHNFFPLFIVTV